MDKRGGRDPVSWPELLGRRVGYECVEIIRNLSWKLAQLGCSIGGTRHFHIEIELFIIIVSMLIFGGIMDYLCPHCNATKEAQQTPNPSVATNDKQNNTKQNNLYNTVAQTCVG